MDDLAMKPRKRANRKQGTFAWRLRQAREEKELEQTQVVDELKRRFGYEMTYAAYNKHETGDTENPKLAVLDMLSQVLGCSIDYLVSGREPEEKTAKFWSEEADKAGNIIDGMLPQTRGLALCILDQLMQMDKEQRSNEYEIAHLLAENINLMKRGSDQERARRYIEAAGYFRK